MRPSRRKRVSSLSAPSQVSSQIMVLFLAARQKRQNRKSIRVTLAGRKFSAVHKNSAIILCFCSHRVKQPREGEEKNHNLDWQHEWKQKSNNQESLESFITLCVISIYPPLNIKKNICGIISSDVDCHSCYERRRNQIAFTRKEDVFIYSWIVWQQTHLMIGTGEKWQKRRLNDNPIELLLAASELLFFHCSCGSWENWRELWGWLKNKRWSWSGCGAIIWFSSLWSSEGKLQFIFNSIKLESYDKFRI